MTAAPVVAVFGALSDIAAAVARRYAARGARLVLVGRDAASLDRAAADLRIRGAPEAVTEVADFAAIDRLDATAAACWERFGSIDVALIAYGANPDQLRAEQEAVTTAAAVTLNLGSPAALANALAARMAAAGSGTLAVISSVAGDRGRQSNYVYGAAKGGLQRALEGLRHRLARRGVRVLDIRPGFVSTRMTAHLDRRGPLWATPDRVAADIVRAIDRGRAVLYTPWFWRPIMMMVRAAPRAVFHRTRL